MLNCERVQAALSARLDGEDPGIDESLVDAHLSGCAECQAYLERAARLNRQLTFKQAEGTTDLFAPDLSMAIMADVESQHRQLANFQLAQTAVSRIALCVFGVFYIVGAVGYLIQATNTAPGNTDADPLWTAAAVDSAATRLAFAFGVFAAAWKPKLAGGMLPIFGSLTMFTLGFGVRDVLLGGASTSSVAGWLLLVATTAVLAWMWMKSSRAGSVTQGMRSLGAGPIRGN